MYLIINTAISKSLEVILAKNSTDFNIREIEGEYKQAENLLPLIKESLNNQHNNLEDIKGIAVVTGPGGFTALRIGVVTANVLAYALNVPVIGLNLTEFSNNEELIAKTMTKLKSTKTGGVVMPEYGREPNIS
ncbi:tRNA (adenosine(37)-N6)-threonylcarbamoyltransferase complex dimerization subunit type 1 TsaB [Candidatus Falkowbacteria bacterium]|uniref:tRNA (Adenosine(37)-N6)-threonylcarbamoyltransferase complex dimerization subunit type 1 TsaB n=1 Tax=Candidatus Buchananbacteria bacterium CG10_big_fil_rev_8_21_14_0_10_33_19 TaxID=1974525 RepID=A0A2H0W446_9BACT|nr:tRNA (adenosine(37)-N6)-threonylcarbamoyltransferase complex dimerization subunit type 1 TsaB [Candidatus Falkowbacteria bacterium]PIS06142.1 MAG: tRNA (adenosine(37)-N6)-threonylcarbamoyltransferase complex dimerization subunit type 1 TsaB [Candidatus Buchananbacteria bacterium CG10_big_fil_rev_8_21_14_0_10_33_19]